LISLLHLEQCLDGFLLLIKKTTKFRPSFFLKNDQNRRGLRAVLLEDTGVATTPTRPVLIIGPREIGAARLDRSDGEPKGWFDCCDGATTMGATPNVLLLVDASAAVPCASVADIKFGSVFPLWSAAFAET